MARRSVLALALGRMEPPCQNDDMSRVTVEIPDKMLLALKLSPEKLGEELKLVAAVKLYELGRLSSGAAAELAGIPKPVFLTKLADYGVDSFRLTREELDAETRLA